MPGMIFKEVRFMYIEYEINTEEREKLENMIFYYKHHGVENMIKSHPSFVVDDFEKILEIISKILEV